MKKISKKITGVPEKDASLCLAGTRTIVQRSSLGHSNPSCAGSSATSATQCATQHGRDPELTKG